MVILPANPILRQSGQAGRLLAETGNRGHFGDLKSGLLGPLTVQRVNRERMAVRRVGVKGQMRMI